MESPRYYLDIACRQQAAAELTFLYDRMPIAQIPASFTALGDTYMCLRAEGKDFESRHIISGHPCRCHFAIRDVEQLSLSFTARVERFYNGPYHSLYIILSLPRGLDMQRRRFAKRLELGGDEEAPASIWHGVFDAGPGGALPALAWRELAAPGCRLGEISASGCRILAPGDEESRFSLEDNILLRGDFGRPKSGPLYLLGNVVRKSLDGGEMTLGCRFRAWRRAGSPPETWYRAVEGEGIGAVGEWVQRKSFPGRGAGGGRA